jgi:hypothetical protein
MRMRRIPAKTLFLGLALLAAKAQACDVVPEGWQASSPIRLAGMDYGTYGSYTGRVFVELKLPTYTTWSFYFNSGNQAELAKANALLANILSAKAAGSTISVLGSVDQWCAHYLKGIQIDE